MKHLDIYLAGPYTSNDDEVRKNRFIELTKMCGKIMKLGYVVFSPISHSHLVAEMVKMPTDWEFWKKIDLKFMDCCKILAIYAIPGWTESLGVSEEMRYARSNDIPIIIFKNLSEFKREIKR